MGCCLPPLPPPFAWLRVMRKAWWEAESSSSPAPPPTPPSAEATHGATGQSPFGVYWSEYKETPTSYEGRATVKRSEKRRTDRHLATRNLSVAQPQADVQVGAISGKVCGPAWRVARVVGVHVRLRIHLNEAGQNHPPDQRRWQKPLAHTRAARGARNWPKPLAPARASPDLQTWPKPSVRPRGSAEASRTRTHPARPSIFGRSQPPPKNQTSALTSNKLPQDAAMCSGRLPWLGISSPGQRVRRVVETKWAARWTSASANGM